MSQQLTCRTVCAVSLLFACGQTIWAEDLSQLSDEIRRATGGVSQHQKEEQPRKSSYCDDTNNRNCKSSAYDDDEDYDSEFWTAIATGAAFVASAPFWAPAALAGDDMRSPAFFPRYPYQEPVNGYLMIAPDVPRRPREWGGRFNLDYGENFDELTTINGRLILETTSRFGLDTETRFFDQRIDAGRHDSLWLGDANAMFRFAQSSRFQMRVGAGINWFSDRNGSELGFNLTYGGDWFPVDPFIVSADLDWGEVGHASLFHAKVTAGIQYHRAEIYTGYDYLDISNSQFNNFIAGVRLWF